MNNSEVTIAIKNLCGNASVLRNGWIHFVYHYLHYLNIPDDTSEMIRMSIPHVANSNDFKKETVVSAVNETNREMKFIKAIVLKNGSISPNYDHKISQTENVGDILEHIIKSLYVASKYLLRKLESI